MTEKRQQKSEQRRSEGIVCYKGDRVILRPVNSEKDLDLLCKWLNDPEVNQFIQALHPLSVYEEREYLEKLHTRKNDIVFAVEAVKPRKLIGVVGLHGINWRDHHATTGSLIGDKKFWGKGYGSEAKMFLLHYAFHNLNLRRISSSAIYFNERSKNCLLKTGYRQEGIRKEVSFRNGRYWDMVEFGIFRRLFDPIWEEYKKNPAKWLQSRSR